MGSKKTLLGALAAVSLVTGGLVFVTVQGEPQAATRAPSAPTPAPEVQVVEAIGRTLPETGSYTGRLTAVEHVDLRPRIGGYIAAVRFREGGLVKRGQVLFELDARTSEAAVARARAQLKQAQERRSLAERKAARANALRAGDVISEAEREAAAAEYAEGDAVVEAARAWLRTATIDLADTRVRAPIDGRAGEALITLGNLVSGGSAGASLLTTIVSVDPLHVEFDLDESTFRRFTRSHRDSNGVPVHVTIGDEGGAAITGRLDYIGNRVDVTTGTVRVRAVIANKDGLLTPGLFARVKLETEAPRPVVLVREETIGTSAQGRFVLVVKPDGMVDLRRVELGENVEGLRVIRSGLTAGERVILKGMAGPGMKVTPKLVATKEGAP